jgi:hypothetical protein
LSILPFAQVPAAPARDAPPAEELSGAVPLSDMSKLPTTQDQYRALEQQIDETRPRV